VLIVRADHYTQGAERAALHHGQLDDPDGIERVHHAPVANRRHQPL